MQFESVHGSGGAIIYSATSKFNQAHAVAPYDVTLTLYSRASSNTFYDKHVVREGESTRQIWDERKGSLTNGGFDPNKLVAASAKGIFTGSNQSTFIRLKTITIKEMIYGLAKCMLENALAGNWAGGVGSYQGHLPIQAKFDTSNSVVSYDTHGNKTYRRSILVGGKLTAAAGRQYAFDLNHCSGHGTV